MDMTQDSLHWAARYIGIRWEAGAQGIGADGSPAFDCWAFFRHVQRVHYGIEVPLITAEDYDDAAALVQIFRGHPERARWEPVLMRQDGDGVVIHLPLHVGIWINVDGGGVLHCVRGAGVVFTHDRMWFASGFGRREYRTFVGVQG